MSGLVYRHYSDALEPGRCVSVDGDAPGRLNISHWPGNRTPARFRHILSTGGCLALAAAEDRAELLEGIDTVTNNHWDTDGLCSVFACIDPEQALHHAPRLIDAAMAGDYQVFTSPEGLKIELTLTALTRHPESPVHSTRFKTDLERRQAQYEHGLDLLPRLLEDADLHLSWIEDEYRRIQSDLRSIREEDVSAEIHRHADFAVVRADAPLHAVAVQTALGCDRVLQVYPGEGGEVAELRLSTRSWFDRDDRAERRDWSDLAKALEETGTVSADSVSAPLPVLKVTDMSDSARAQALIEGFYGIGATR
jgi:hypothetical protein